MMNPGRSSDMPVVTSPSKRPRFRLAGSNRARFGHRARNGGGIHQLPW